VVVVVVVVVLGVVVHLVVVAKGDAVGVRTAQAAAEAEERGEEPDEEERPPARRAAEGVWGNRGGHGEIRAVYGKGSVATSGDSKADTRDLRRQSQIPTALPVETRPRSRRRREPSSVRVVRVEENPA